MKKLNSLTLVIAVLSFYGCSADESTLIEDVIVENVATIAEPQGNPLIYKPIVRDAKEPMLGMCMELRLTPADIAAIISASEKSDNQTYWYKMLLAAPCTFKGPYEIDGKSWAFTYHPTGFLTMDTGTGEAKEKMHYICFDCPIFPDWIIQNNEGN